MCLGYLYSKSDTEVGVAFRLRRPVVRPLLVEIGNPESKYGHPLQLL